jgi:hypothetical protein
MIVDTQTKDEENNELRELVTRQHKALQLQNEQYEQLNDKNESLVE